MNWKIKLFNELTTDELYEILRLRAEVFVVEQDCAYQDLDLKDRLSYHLFLEENNEVIAYLRIIQKNVSYPEISIGRVITKKTYRGKGIAREMVQKAINYVIDKLKENKIRISAQAYLLEFYKSLGFKQTSDIYLEDGIKHIQMLFERN